jgi:hypothetical protein
VSDSTTAAQLQEELLQELDPVRTPYDYFQYLPVYAKEKGLDTDDPYVIADDKQHAKDFMAWVEANDIEARIMREDPMGAPPKMVLDDASPLPPRSWLIFSAGKSTLGDTLDTIAYPMCRTPPGPKNLTYDIGAAERVYAVAWPPPWGAPMVNSRGNPTWEAAAKAAAGTLYVCRCDAAVQVLHLGNLGQREADYRWAIFPIGAEYDLFHLDADVDPPMWVITVDDKYGSFEVSSEDIEELLDKLDGALKRDKERERLVSEAEATTAFDWEN